MSATEGAVLVWYQGAAGGQVGGVVAAGGVPDDREAVADQAERDGALDCQAGAVAGLAHPGVLAGVAEADLHLPPARVAFHQLGGDRRKVGADQGHLEAVGRAGVADQDHLDGSGAEHRRPQAGEAGDGGKAVAAVAGHLLEGERGGGGAGEVVQVG
jgi:hypothetical protein